MIGGLKIKIGPKKLPPFSPLITRQADLKSYFFGITETSSMRKTRSELAGMGPAPFSP